MATYRVAPVATARVVTDWNLPAEWRSRLAELKVDTTIVEPGTQP